MEKPETPDQSAAAFLGIALAAFTAEQLCDLLERLRVERTEKELDQCVQLLQSNQSEYAALRARQSVLLKTLDLLRKAVQS